MSKNKSRFIKVEERIQALVEGSFARLLAGRLSPQDVAVRLARALEENIQPAPDGSPDAAPIVPNTFTVHLNLDDYDVIMKAAQEKQTRLESVLAEALIEFAARVGLTLPDTPSISLLPEELLPHRAVRIEAYHEDRTIRSTQTMMPVTADSALDLPRNPQLILNGSTYIPLNRHVINIGRRHDNHIVIDDARVSRSHAQIRLRFGRYVIYDLGSSSGTQINGQSIQEHILRPGDVITLSNTVMVYIEDEISTGQQLIQKDLSKTETNMRRPSPKPKRDDDVTL